MATVRTFQDEFYKKALVGDDDILGCDDGRHLKRETGI